MTTSTLQEFERDLLALVGDANDSLPYWTDSILEEAIRSALRWFSVNGPEVEGTFTVTSAGYEQDLSAMTPVPEGVFSITYPWADGQSIDDGYQVFRYMGNSTVRMDTMYPSVGDKLRVRYYPKWTIENLDGATATNLRSEDTRPFLLGAAHMLFFELAVRAGITGDDNFNRFRGVSDMYLEKFHQENSGPEFIEWGTYA